MTEALVATDPPRGRWLGALLPGVPQILLGHLAMGGTLLTLWAGGVWIIVARAPRVAEAVTSGGFGDRLAVAALVAILFAVWTASWRSLHGPALAWVSGPWRGAASAFLRNPTAVAGLGILTLLYATALVAPLVAPFDPLAPGDLATERLIGPSPVHPLGTDYLGRDVLSRILYGARISLSIGVVAIGIAVTVGTLFGAVSGYLGGRVDTILMRLVDVVMAFPRLILLIVITAVFPSSIPLIVVVLGLTMWPATARLVRAEVLSLKEREFVLAARALGYSRRRIVLGHLIPNALAPVIVAASLGIGHTIILEAGLSFLGLGVQPPTPSWGSMVASGRADLLGAWWLATFPGLAIVTTVLAFNLVGDGIRDALDPRRSVR